MVGNKSPLSPVPRGISLEGGEFGVGVGWSAVVLSGSSCSGGNYSGKNFL